MIEVKTKKRKVSKKTKKSWRKHVDTTDVDKFLENERLEERLGIPFSERSDTDLFTIDKDVASKEITFNDKKQRRLALKNTEPKCFSILKPHTLVPDPIVKRNRVRTREERKHPILLRKEIQRKSKGILKLKEKLALKNKALADLKRANRPRRGDFKDDIWDKKNTSLPKIDTEWMTSDTVRHTLTHMGVKKRKLPTSLHKKPSVLPAIEAPHPGTSYNPSYNDHQDLLNEIAKKELELMKEEAHLNRVTTKMFKKVSLDEKDKNTLKELIEGLPIKKDKLEQSDNNDNDDDDGDDDDTNMDHNITSINPPVKNKKKTLVARRKQKEQKILAHKLAQAKLEKRKVSDIYKLKLLQKQIDAKEKKEKVLQEKRHEQKKLKSVETKTLSKVKFEPVEPSFTLAEELTGNLRNVTRIGNLLKDRYKSLQQRNIVAPANIVLKRTKAKVKRYIKSDHKIKQKE
ncbi:ribosome biogenesis protein NOP53 [Vespula maculifrons]|uniref:Ribosome biogenesis protein NOP53 n=1 Tax=Vespula maculifrons TaxID=7453 RepID=A0ABD2BBF4_VESMC